LFMLSLGLSFWRMPHVDHDDVIKMLPCFHGSQYIE
jgi:hypothetical protein